MASPNNGAPCDRCRYGTYWSTPVGNRGQYGCYYIGITGKPRGCPVSADCDKFEEGMPPRMQLGELVARPHNKIAKRGR